MLANSTDLVSSILAEHGPGSKTTDSVDINVRHLGAYGAPPICYAIQHDNSAMVQLLLEHAAKPAMALNLTDEVSGGGEEVVLYLISYLGALSILWLPPLV